MEACGLGAGMQAFFPQSVQGGTRSCARVLRDAFGDHLGRGTGGERGSGPCLQGPRVSN